MIRLNEIIKTKNKISSKENVNASDDRNITDSVNSLSDKLERRKITYPGYFQCTKCNKTFPIENDLNEHLLMH